MATTPRPSLRELATSRIGNLRIVPPGSAEDPIDDALRAAQRITAATIVDTSVQQVRTEGRKAELEEKRTELEIRKLERENQAMSGESSSFQQYLLDQLSTMQAELGRMQVTMVEQDRRATEAKIAELNGELANLRASLQQPQSEGGQALVVRQIEEASRLLDAIKSLAPPEPARPVVASVEDPGFLAWARTQDFRIEQWRAQREDEKADREARLRLEQYKVDQDMDLRREQVKITNRALEETAPKLLAMFTELISMFQARGGGAPAAAAHAAPVVVNPPPGAKAQACADCGTTLFFFEEDAPYRLACPNCGRTYTVTVDREESIDAAADSENGQQSSRPIPA